MVFEGDVNDLFLPPVLRTSPILKNKNGGSQKKNTVLLPQIPLIAFRGGWDGAENTNNI